MEELGGKIRVMRRYNTGNYTHIEIEYEITGPYEKLVNSPELCAGFMKGTTKMGDTMDQAIMEILSNYNKRTAVPQ